MMFLIYTVLSLKRCGLDNFYRLDTFLLKVCCSKSLISKIDMLGIRKRLRIYPNKQILATFWGMSYEVMTP